MTSSNKAAWVPGKGLNCEVGPADMWKPGPGELLIRNHAIAINPADWMMQDTGIYVQKWPVLTGHDSAGEIVEVGEGVSNFKKGDRVVSHSKGLITGQPQYGAFQEYSVASVYGTCTIPSNVSYEDACAIPSSVSTVAAGYYIKGYLDLPYPSLNPKQLGKAILVWGGSSSCGSQAIQLAKASGLEVVATASPHNFEYCKKLGAKHVFDHSSPSIVGDLVDVLEKEGCAGAFDATAKRDTVLNIATVLAQLGGGLIATVLPPPEDPLPATVTAKMVYAYKILTEEPEVSEAVWKNYLPAALASGQYKPAPPPKIVGNGLDHIQSGIDQMRKGVSATKLTVTV